MILALLILAAVAAVPFLAARWRAEQQRRQLAAQFRESLSGLAHALRIGVGLTQAIEYTAREGAAPLAGEWRRLLQALQIGQPMAVALPEFSRRVPLKEVAWFQSAVLITQRSGGSLAEVLETLAQTLQERHLLREKVSALTAQGKASGILLAILPYAMMAVLSVMAPDLITPLFRTVKGQCVIAGITVSIAIGAMLIKHIVTIEVD